MAQNRLNSYKNNGKDGELRKKLKEESIELRKSKREDQLNKRRNLQEFEDDFEDDGGIMSPEKKIQSSIMSIEEIMAGINSTDFEKVYESTRNARKVLSKETNPPIDIFIKAETVPKFVSFLQCNEYPQLQFEAAWALTNIASGNQEQTRTVVDAGACQQFINLLESPHRNVMEQSIWGLSNIAGDGPHYRDFIINAGIVPKLVKLVTPENASTLTPAFMGNVAWLISNLCRHKSPPTNLDAIRPCLRILKIFLSFDHPSVISDCCWSLSYLSDGTNDRIEAVCQLDVIPKLVDLCTHSPDRMILVPALRTLGNIVTGNDQQTQLVVDAGALKAFKLLMEKQSLNMVKECVWAISNVTAGNTTQIQCVMNEGLIEPMISVLTHGDVKSQKEAVWAICNLTCSGSAEQIAYVVRAGVLEPLCNVLGSCSDSRLIVVVLDAFKNTLNAAAKIGELEAVLNALEEIGFLEKLEMLQLHENEDVYKNAVLILETFWGTEDDEDANVAPAASGSGDGFNFSPAAAEASAQSFNF